MLKETQLELMADRVYERVKAVNTAYLERVGERYKQLGEISPTDVNRLTRILQWRTSDVSELQALLAKAMNENIKDVENILEGIAKDNYNFAEPFYEAKGVEYVAYAQNAILVDYTNDIIKQTQGTLSNISKTTAVQSSYINAIDKAVTASTLGLESYSSSIRSAIREVADAGINQVEYDKNGKGYRRRVDTSVRQNVLSAMKQVNLGSSERIGQQFGNDGWEISYHSNPRPSHRAMGGQQYTIDEFEQQGISDLLNDYNCLHYKYPIVIGISEPSIDKKELTELKSKDILEVEYDGKKYDRYEMSQIQRRLETAIRKEKDAAVLASKADNMILRREAQATINNLTAQYEEVSRVAGLPTKVERMTVARFRPVKAVEGKTKSVKVATPTLKASKQKYEYVNAKTIEEANVFAKDVLKINTKNYSDMNLDVANGVNKAIVDVYNEFEGFDESRMFKGLNIVSRRNKNYAAYSLVTKEVWLYKSIVGNKNSYSKMLETAQDMKDIGWWSSSEAMGTVKHELGHALMYHYIEKDKGVRKKLDDYLALVKKEANVIRWQKVQSKEELAKIKDKFSYYGLASIEEFVAEAVAEYMTGNPREIAKNVIKILKGE